MNYKLIIILLVAVVALMGASTASAKSNYLTSFNQHYETAGTRLDSCTTCHNGGAVNPYGRAYLGSGRNFASIENLDSDKDGFTNLAEISALNFPGKPDDHPQNTSEIIPETTVNVTEPSVNETPEQPSTEVPVSNATSEQPTEVPDNTTGDNTTGEQESPGFEVIPVVVGLLAVACLKRRDIRK
ncbi:MAG: PGF-CTERM sorting domain-containing protein [Methanosarcina sp.]|uniref:PGF-CTERM sorting domain-containing protein n=1 Tax=Methanosarcina sp. TaxID=2213 RepID=UPI00260D8292|nr:PGF-CTERM sorting domain-containing protein [Methanosarcina sp.]MDD3248237.1 PGF-CTERM sorting domain-containing protein [Methanosarcina sp.]